jgi:hypothetical protein
MVVFEAFRKKHPSSSCRAVNEINIQKYIGKLPEPIIELWREQGWCSYSNGLMWFVNPDDYANVMNEWLREPDNSIVFARSGFGDLFTWNGKAIYQLFIHSGSYGRLMKNINTYMETMMIEDASLEDSHYLKLHNKAVEKLGILNHDECYTFVPALVMGGRESLDTIQKVKHLEQLLILAQLHGKLVPS